ncbi:hypothetical protein [Candidatus Endomicrobiellum trichonymphae]|uniref:hypothetical protein n=1 Tax=Endomicrobium trichonymphae TaxID=1408204 RepID=UPI000BBB6540|nr:hypothetical protein [Candidatus Endomicrobium trichonymphae]
MKKVVAGLMMIMLSVSNSFSGEVVTKSEKAEIVESINVQDFNPYPVEERIKKGAPYLMLKFKHWCKMLLGAFTAGGGGLLLLFFRKQRQLPLKLAVDY